MNDEVYEKIKQLLFENEGDFKLLRRVNRLSYGLLKASTPDIINQSNHEET